MFVNLFLLSIVLFVAFIIRLHHIEVRDLYPTASHRSIGGNPPSYTFLEAIRVMRKDVINKLVGNKDA